MQELPSACLHSPGVWSCCHFCLPSWGALNFLCFLPALVMHALGTLRAPPAGLANTQGTGGNHTLTLQVPLPHCTALAPSSARCSPWLPPGQKQGGEAVNGRMGNGHFNERESETEWLQNHPKSGTKAASDAANRNQQLRCGHRGAPTPWM